VLKRWVVFALSQKSNPNRLECHWYPVYRRLFEVLESDPPYTTWLAPQFAVCREPIGAPPLVDFAVVVSRPPKDKKMTCIDGWTMSPNGQRYVPIGIKVPTLSAGDVIVPVIIEIKTSKSDHLSDIYRALGAASDELLQQAAFLFSDFEWQQDVIAIAGVGIHWWWFRIPRPSPAHSNQDSGSGHERGRAPSSNSVDPSSDRPLNATNNHPTNIPKPTLPDEPFMIGTTRSAEAVSELKALIHEMAYRDLGAVSEVSDDSDNAEEPHESLRAFNAFAAVWGSGVDSGAE